MTHRISFERPRDLENAATQREIELLRQENILYRFERRLPPGDKKDEQM